MMTETLRVACSSVRRCPACERTVESPPPSHCPSCGFDFRDDSVAGADVTPYAKAYARGNPGWWPMCEWVWFAGWERLKHLALMRASAASRRFALLNILLLTAGLGLFQATGVGWRWVTDSPAIEPTGSTRPAGDGWIHVAAAPRPIPPDQAGEIPVDLWWNPLQMVIAVVVAIAVGLLLMWFVQMLVRAGVTKAHTLPYRGDQRATAAMHYSTAWTIPVVLGAIVAGLRPLSYVGRIVQWPWYPPERVFELSAAVLAGFGLAMWWFWLVRLGAAAPVKTRGRVVAFFALGAPLIVAAAAAGWWVGLDQVYGPLFKGLKVHF